MQFSGVYILLLFTVPATWQQSTVNPTTRSDESFCTHITCSVIRSALKKGQAVFQGTFIKDELYGHSWDGTEGFTVYATRCTENSTCTVCDPGEEEIFKFPGGTEHGQGPIPVEVETYLYVIESSNNTIIEMLGPCTPTIWMTQLGWCQIDCDLTSSCYCQYGNYGKHTTPQLPMPSTTPDECGQEICDSACFASRFNNATEVFLGEVNKDLQPFPVSVHCYLKAPTTYKDGYIEANVKDCKTPIQLPPPGALYVFFGIPDPDRFGKPDFLLLTAEPIQVNTSTAWEMMTSLCGVDVFISKTITRQVSTFCCHPNQTTPSTCLTAVSVVEINDLNKVAQISQPTKSCQEYSCPFEVCDSNCFMSRFNASTDVFWGEALTQGGEQVSVYCWLKRSHLAFDQVSFKNTQQPPFDNMCSSGQMTVPTSGTGQYLFFAESTGNETFAMIAKPVQVSSYLAWQEVIKICYVSPEDSTENHASLPFGSCVKNEVIPCLEDIAISEITRLNGVSTTTILPVSSSSSLDWWAILVIVVGTTFSISAIFIGGFVAVKYKRRKKDTAINMDCNAGNIYERSRARPDRQLLVSNTGDDEYFYG